MYQRCRASLSRTHTVLLVAAVVLAGLVSVNVAALRALADTAPASGTPATVSADALPTVQQNGVVWAQVTVGNTVYATGSFSQTWPAGTTQAAGTTPRANLLAYDITTGNLITSFNHSLNAQGLAITASPDGSRVYVGGDFTTVDGQPRNRIAAFNTATGALDTTFNASLAGQVAAIAATNSTVYVGGNFFQASGVARTRLAAFTASGGSLLSWAPTADDNFISAMVLSPDNSRVIVGGRFSTINHTNTYGLGSVDATSGAVLPFAINQTIQDYGTKCGILNLSTDGKQVYGSGFAYGCGNFEGTFAADPTTGAIGWINDCHGDTYGTYPVGDVLYSVSHAHSCAAVGEFPDTNPRIWHHALASTTYATTKGIGPDDYGWNYNGIPASNLLHWYPAFGIGSYTGAYQSAWSVTGNANYISLGGEFPTANGVAQQGLVRYALPAKAPLKVAPVATSTITPTVISPSSGTARVAWTATWDYDNENLTYNVLRDGVQVGSVTQKSNFWKLPAMGYLDRGLAPGSQHTYRVQVVDPNGNKIGSGTSNSVTISSAARSNYADAVVSDGASSYWRFGESARGTAYDSAGFTDLTEDAGVSTGAAGAIAGDADTAASFANGTAVAAATQTGPDVFSTEAWFKTTTTAGGKIIGFGDGATGTQSSNYDRHTYMDNAGRIVFGVYNNGIYTAVSPTSYNDGAYHHVVSTLSSAGMALYVDGKKVGANTRVTSGQPFTGRWRVGGDNLNGWSNQPSSANFQGVIDDVAVYPKALTLTQVQQHYRTAGGTVTGPPAAPTDTYGKAVYQDAPDTYWRLDGTGPGEPDASPNGNAGTYAGGVSYRTASPVTGTTGTGVTFNGADGTLASNAAIAGPTVYSEELWFRTATTRGGKLIGFGNTQSGTSSAYDRHVYMENSGQLTFGVWTGQPNTITSSRSYNDDAWHHVVATQGANGMVLYVDGVNVGTNPQTDAQGYDGYWRVGGDSSWGGDSSFLAGSVDEVAVYPTVLSAARVQAHFAASGLAPTPVNQAPKASFTQSCTDLACSFDSSASSDDSAIASRSWDFGDGATSAEVKPSHTYSTTTTKTYTVKLVVTDDKGLTDTLTRDVTVTPPAPVNQPPKAAFTQSCTDLTCTFDSSTSTDDVGVTGRSWTFGDGATSTETKPAHAYPAAGDYRVTLTVTDAAGATDSTSVTVSPRPPANPATSAIASDAFNRTQTNTWGTADKGGAWTTVGNAANLSVSGGSGVLKLAAAGNAPGALLNSVSSSDTDSRITYTTDKVATGNGVFLYLVGRRVSANNEYRARIRILSNNTVALALTKLAGSASETLIGSEVVLSGLTYTPGMLLNVRYQVTGTSPTTLRLKVWQNGTTEPTDWRLSATDANAGLQAAGAVGVASYLSGTSTNAPVLVKAASYSVNPTVTAPVAAFTTSTTGLQASADGSTSTGASTYTWSWGDGILTDGVRSTHAYAVAGTYRITLTVKNAAGLTDVTTRTVTVS